VASGYGVTPPAIVLFKDFDEGKVTFDGAYDKTEIGAFVAANSLPLVVPFTQESAPKIFGGDIKNHVLLFLDPKDDKTEGHVEAATEAAKQQKGKHLFVTVSPEDDRILEFFSIVAADLPTVRMVHMGDGSMRKYQYPNPEITAAGLTQFIADFDAGKLVADMKSQEPPKDNDEHPVRVIVGKSFDDEVVNNEKDVFVMFFAPWCGHCKRLQPTWHELGVKFQGVDSAVIAQMDATANEHEAVDIQGFPTIKLWPGKEKANPVDFDGSRDLDGFVAFLKTKASTPIVFPETADKKDEL
jgi:protein disulfide-isomerase A1